MMEEMAEICNAVYSGEKEGVVKECADLANFAMMADVCNEE